MQEITMRGVNLDHPRARGQRALGRFGESLYDVPNARDVDLVRHDVAQIKR